MKNIDPSVVVAGRNRGIILDIIVFLINLFLMSDLSDRVNDVIGIGRGRPNDARTMGIMAGYCALACILPASGALLKYVSGSQKHTPHFYRKTWGRQFFSIMTLILILQFVSQVVFLIAEYKYQGRLLAFLPDSGSLSILLKLVLAICVVFIVVNPIAVRINFVKNRRHYFTGFFRGIVEFFGDSSLFLNMILFQIFWGIFMTDFTQDWDVLERLLALGVTSFVLYFPPRLMYMAEDGHRGIAWVTMFLANLPILIRIIIIS